MASLTTIEQAIIGRLSTTLPYLKTCGSLSEFLSRNVSEIEELSPLCPAAFVVYQRGAYSQKMSGVLDREMIFSVIVAVRDLRGDAAVRNGAAGDKGIYDVLEDVRTTLTDQTCGIDIDPFAPVSEEAVAGTRNFAVYEIRFRTRGRFAS